MHLLGVMKMIDDLSMAHDNLQRELADIKQRLGKDKHELIKSNISLNKKVQELKKENELLKSENERYRRLLAKIENNMGITPEEDEKLLREIEIALGDEEQLELF